MNSRHFAVLLVGPTASGKTPLGKMIEEKGLNGRKCHHFDFGSELRLIAAGADPRFVPAELDFIRGVLSEGLLLENEHFPLAQKILEGFARKRNIGESGTIVLNGLPRHRGQAEKMDDVVEVKSVIALQCSQGDIMGRIQSNAAGDRTGRADDSCELVAKKIALYDARTAPMIDYYGSRKIPVIRACVRADSVTGGIYEEIAAGLRRAAVFV